MKITKEIKVWYSHNTRETGNYVYDGIENIPSNFMENYKNVNTLYVSEENFEGYEKTCEDMFKFHQGETGLFKLSEEDINDNVVHSSMMCGDIVEIDGNRFMVDRFGFTKV